MRVKENLKSYQLQIGLFYLKVVKTVPQPVVEVEAPSTRSSSLSMQDRAIQITAAQTRVIADQKIGRETPDWIIALSKEQPEYELLFDMSPYQFKK